MMKEKRNTTTVDEEIDQILAPLKLRDVTKNIYRHKMLQLIEELNPNTKDLDFLITNLIML